MSKRYRQIYLEQAQAYVVTAWKDGKRAERHVFTRYTDASACADELLKRYDDVRMVCPGTPEP